MPTRIVFVCTANICRSAFMQTYARASLDSPDVEFTSAGTHGFVDHPMSDEMAVEAALWGLDVTDFRSRPLTDDILDSADLLVTAERAHRQFVLDDHPAAFATVLTLGQASRAATGMAPSPTPERVVAELARRRGRAEAVDDVTDPYRRGAAAQEAAARLMSAMLDPLLAALGRIDRTPTRKSDHG
jgi:sulfate adenylyltransferase